MIDIIGTIYTAGEYDTDGNINFSPEPLPGWHVIATRKLAGLSNYLQSGPSPRVFAGATTHYYIFESEQSGRELIGWDGEQCNPTYELDPEPILAALTDAVQKHLDTTARTRRYDGILSLCTYATSTNTKFAAEGQAGVNWRDACWAKCYEIMAECAAGTRPIPTPEELVGMLPGMAWPE